MFDHYQDSAIFILPSIVYFSNMNYKIYKSKINVSFIQVNVWNLKSEDLNLKS